jgi:MraZ protein
MTGLLGSYVHQIDDKGRLSLPAAFRRDAADAPMVLLKAQHEALTLYPPETWAEVEKRMRESLRRKPETRPAILGVIAAAIEVTPDKQGRIPIPTRLREAVGIDGSAMVVGVLDRIEIWNPERFQATISETTDFESLAPQIFG